MCLGVPAKIIEITDRTQKLAIVDVSGARRVINITCIVANDTDLETCIGKWVLIHVGLAASIISETEAMETLKVLAELGKIQEQIAAMQPSRI